MNEFGHFDWIDPSVRWMNCFQSGIDTLYFGCCDQHLSTQIAKFYACWQMIPQNWPDFEKGAGAPSLCLLISLLLCPGTLQRLSRVGVTALSRAERSVWWTLRGQMWDLGRFLPAPCFEPCKSCLLGLCSPIPQEFSVLRLAKDPH